MNSKEELDNSMRLMRRALEELVVRHRQRVDPGTKGYYDTSRKGTGSYPFIPLSASEMWKTFRSLRQALQEEGLEIFRKDRKFLDAGCGLGNALFYASATGLAEITHGIEYFPKTARAGRNFLACSNKPEDRIAIFTADIMTFKRYSEYDIIYYYCPFHYTPLEILFEERLEDEMRVGAILVPVNKQGCSADAGGRFKRIGNTRGFVKVSAGKRKRSYRDQAILDIKEAANDAGNHRFETASRALKLYNL
jgi:SAM-dependent methyltransferase